MLARIEVPYDVIARIAKDIDTNVRDLEGVFNRVAAYASLTNSAYDTSILEESRKSVDSSILKGPVTIEDIERLVAHYFNLSVSDLHQKNRAPRISKPRQIAMYLCRELTKTSLPSIARYFGGLNHTTVLRAYDKIKNGLQKDSDLKSLIEILTAHIKGQ